MARSDVVATARPLKRTVSQFVSALEVLMGVGLVTSFGNRQSNLKSVSSILIKPPFASCFPHQKEGVVPHPHTSSNFQSLETLW